MALLLALAIAASQFVVLPRAHAHNDYAQAKPLAGAMALGFCSIEADVYLVDGKLLVGHDRPALKPERDLESMYLKPLAAAAKAHDGHVYGSPAEVTLLIDLKADGLATYRALEQTLVPYREMLTGFKDGVVTRRAVTVILSGDRPIETVAGQKERWAFLDGRPDETGPGSADPKVTPLVSAAWGSHFRWNGLGAMPEAERTQLREMAGSLHRRGQRLRFWATHETHAMWRELVAAEVDLIGTDRQPELASFLRGLGL